MKFLVLAACVAVSAANLVTYPNGAVVPADTAEVQLARAAHLATKGALPLAYGAWNGAYPYAGAYAYGAYPYAGAYNGAYGYAGYPYAAGYAYGGLVAHPNGAIVPVDEPAVQAAKAEHYAAHGGLPLTYAAGLPYAYGYAGLVAHPNGAVVPAEPADVVSARAEHLAAHAAA